MSCCQSFPDDGSLLAYSCNAVPNQKRLSPSCGTLPKEIEERNHPRKERGDRLCQKDYPTAERLAIKLGNGFRLMSDLD